MTTVSGRVASLYAHGISLRGIAHKLHITVGEVRRLLREWEKSMYGRVLTRADLVSIIAIGPGMSVAEFVGLYGGPHWGMVRRLRHLGIRVRPRKG